MAVIVDTGVDISIHAPHTGRDSRDRPVRSGGNTFQSTRPIRGATNPSTSLPNNACKNFNPRAPYGARPHISSTSAEQRGFQSTRPIRGATGECLPAGTALLLFQSTRPIRGATVAANGTISRIRISIHAPHTGRDLILNFPGCYRFRDFNPRAPYGARLPVWNTSP